MAIRFLSLSFFFMIAFWVPHRGYAQTLELEQVVMVSRHNIRSPLTPPNVLRGMTEKIWPTWPGKPGDLTERGHKLSQFMGIYYRQHFSDRGLFPHKGCIDTSALRIWSNTTQRTRATGKALLEGMFPDCPIKVDHSEDLKKPDSLFFPLENGVCTIDSEKVKTALWGQIGTSTGNSQLMGMRLLRAYAYPLDKLQDTLECCKANLCPNSSETEASCSLDDIPMDLTWDMEKKRPILKGPLHIAYEATDNFLLQYAEGFPMKDVGWGKIKRDELRDLFRFQSLVFELEWKNPYVAKRQSAMLMAAIREALIAAQDDRQKRKSNTNKLTLFVGHDTNIAALSAMLGLDFLIDGYQPQQVPLGGALAFELLKDPESEEEFVQVVFYSQTLEQLRDQTPLDANTSPDRLLLNLPACGDPGSLCPLKKFTTLLQNVIDPECVNEPYIKSIIAQGKV
jgi:4-phytase/acid phosphatase